MDDFDYESRKIFCKHYSKCLLESAKKYAKGMDCKDCIDYEMEKIDIDGMTYNEWNDQDPFPVSEN